jgi:hypothetical protein
MKEPIPGERDETTAAPTTSGIVGTTGYGGDLPPELTNDPTLTEEEHQQIRWENGGRPAEKPPDVPATGRMVPRPGPDTEAHPGERKPAETDEAKRR